MRWMHRSVIAAALALPLSTVARADDEPAPAPEPTPPPEPAPEPAPEDAPLRLEIPEDVPPREVPQTTMSASELRRITTVHPRSYNDARVIGEAFRGGTPVIMNLSDMDDADAKRLVDFSAGLIFGLHGAIERVTNKVFLLSPEHVEITGEEQAAPQEGRAVFYNQS